MDLGVTTSVLADADGRMSTDHKSDLWWKVRHRNVVSPFAIASEIVVAEKI
jgi:hypothetical protein